MLEQFKNDIEALKKVNNKINLNDVILWLNENDVNYIDWNDFERFSWSCLFILCAPKR